MLRTTLEFFQLNLSELQITLIFGKLRMILGLSCPNLARLRTTLYDFWHKLSELG
ncbi:hypothetical protein [Neobacillus cucumis]|uniref:hypothetical protein n=1 Tax=Neobacillus cucumis TaxID=1740721 RepID=UPI001965E7DF|nr:hypothetical protein [Neobacillus cucumis]MBM7653236.1 hypothetical protein [Neobacillus cucumis]